MVCLLVGRRAASRAFPAAVASSNSGPGPTHARAISSSLPEVDNALFVARISLSGKKLDKGADLDGPEFGSRECARRPSQRHHHGLRPPSLAPATAPKKTVSCIARYIEMPAIPEAPAPCTDRGCRKGQHVALRYAKCQASIPVIASGVKVVLFTRSPSSKAMIDAERVRADGSARSLA